MSTEAPTPPPIDALFELPSVPTGYEHDWSKIQPIVKDPELKNRSVAQEELGGVEVVDEDLGGENTTPTHVLETSSEEEVDTPNKHVAIAQARWIKDEAFLEDLQQRRADGKLTEEAAMREWQTEMALRAAKRRQKDIDLGRTA